MRRQRTTFMGALSPLAAVSRAFGVFVLDKELNFSRSLYAYSLFLGLGCASYRVSQALMVQSLRRDLVMLLSLEASQLALLAAWLTLFVHCRKCGDLKEGLLGLQEAGLAVPAFRYHWPSFLFLPIKLAEYISLLCAGGFYQPFKFISATVNLVSGGPIEAALLQFVVITDLTSQIVSWHIQDLVTHRLDTQGEILIRHSNVCSLFRRVNSYYSPTIFLSFANFFILVPPFSYSIFRMTFRGWFSIVFIMFQLVRIFYLASVVTSACNSLRKKMDEFNREVNEQLRYHEYLLNDERIRLYVDYQPNVRPKCSTFYVDYQLITKLIATCLTYMVILYQFASKDIAKVD